MKYPISLEASASPSKSCSFHSSHHFHPSFGDNNANASSTTVSVVFLTCEDAVWAFLCIPFDSILHLSWHNSKKMTKLHCKHVFHTDCLNPCTIISQSLAWKRISTTKKSSFLRYRHQNDACIVKHRLIKWNGGNGQITFPKTRDYTCRHSQNGKKPNYWGLEKQLHGLERERSDGLTKKVHLRIIIPDRVQKNSIKDVALVPYTYYLQFALIETLDAMC